MCMPQRKMWEDSHLGNDQEALAVILMWHLSERGTLPWDDFLG